MSWHPRRALDCRFLTGPTASGKSAVALELSERLNAEIVALDSMTLYRGMDIGTAKPTPEDRLRVRHHLLDVYEPHESSTVARYLELTDAAVSDILARRKTPLFVGGTPLYLKALLRGLFDGPPADMALRQELEADADVRGTAALHAELATVDSAAATRIAPADLRRIVRALEVFRLTGKPISAWQQEFDKPANPTPKVACLVWPREALRQRIADRVDAMLDSGWIDETRALLARQPPPGREARQAVGYAEIADHLAGRLDFASMRDLVVTRTRQFAKRQMTWFRHLEECRFFEVSGGEDLASVDVRLHDFFSTK